MATDLTAKDWLEQKYIEWRDEQPIGRASSLAQFARWIGVTPEALNNWLNNDVNVGKKSAAKIAIKLGPEIFDIIGQPRPDNRLQVAINQWGALPESLRKLVGDVAQLTDLDDERAALVAEITSMIAHADAATLAEAEAYLEQLLRERNEK